MPQRGDGRILSAAVAQNRRGTATWGDTSTIWKGDIPSPGSLNVSYDSWKAFYYPSGIPNDGDSDGDGASTVEEYGFATNPLAWETRPCFPLSSRQRPWAARQTNVFTYSKPLDRAATLHGRAIQ
jgi:hypothetical protein